MKLLLLFILTSCSTLLGSRGKIISSNDKSNFVLTDRSGKFFLKRESGISSKEKNFVVKKQIYDFIKRDKELEKSITISETGSLKGIPVLRPKVSQYTVWFEKKKYFVESIFDVKSRSLKFKMNSPESKWTGEKSFKLQDSKRIYCYFSQVYECAKFSGFISKAQKAGAGKMNMYIVWEGYPYIQEQYLNLPQEPFSRATFEFDGVNKNGSKRFTLSLDNQNIFYMVNKEGQFSNIFWVSQGLSMTRQN